jgi:uncharacterized membrane protein
MNLQAVLERVRGSLFYIPALFIAGALGLAWVTVWIDTTHADLVANVPFLLRTTVDSARAVLATTAGATITVAAIVFSVTLVSVQLASSQFSPRVLRGFLRNRFQQVVIGIVMGSFTYELAVLAVTRAHFGVATEVTTRSVSVTLAFAFAVIAVLAIVGFIDHSTRVMDVSELLRRVTNETLTRIEALHLVERAELSEDGVDVGAGAAVAIAAGSHGWVQQANLARIFQAVPPGTLIRLDAEPGDYVSDLQPVVTVWCPVEHDGVTHAVRNAFVLGRNRTMQQDVRFGFRQIVDIALRALSPGINDPRTAVQCIEHLGTVLEAMSERFMPPRVVHGPDGKRVFRPNALTFDGYITLAIEEIRQAAATQPVVITSLLRRMARIDASLRATGREQQLSELHRQARLAIEGLRAGGSLVEDVEAVVDEALDLGLIAQEEA